MHIGDILHVDRGSEHYWDGWNKVNKQNPKEKNWKYAS